MLDIYLERLSLNQAEIVSLITDYLDEIPGIERRWKWSVPCYYRKRLLWYLNAVKNDAVELCFMRGHLMEIADTRLVARGRSRVKGITIHDPRDMDWTLVQLCIDLALELDD